MIRDSKPEDIEAIMQLWLAVNVDTHHYVAKEYWHKNYDMVKAAISEGVYVYEEQGEILGFLGCIDSYIAGIFVQKENRSKGIGKHLVDYTKDKFNYLSLDVYCNNAKAIEFYQREGFHITDTHLNHDTGLEEHRMEWKR